MNRILVIDDEEGVRDAFSLALRSTAYSVELAGSGEAGLEAARGARPDLVFLDLRMPGMNGVETLEQLHGLYPDLAVYIVTAFYQEFMAPLAELAGRGVRFEVARKPLSGEEIRKIARAVFEGPQVTGPRD